MNIEHSNKMKLFNFTSTISSSKTSDNIRVTNKLNNYTIRNAEPNEISYVLKCLRLISLARKINAILQYEHTTHASILCL